MAFPLEWSLGSFLSGISHGRRQTADGRLCMELPAPWSCPPPHSVLPALSQAQTLAPFITTNSTGVFFSLLNKGREISNRRGAFRQPLSPGVCSRSLHKITSLCCREDNNGEWVPKSLKLL